MLSTLDTTDALLMICGPEVPTLKNVHLGLQTLELLAFPAGRVELVLNRASDKAGVSKAEIEAALGKTVSYELPADRVVPVCVNRGQPAVFAEPRSDFAKAVRELARAMAPVEAGGETAKRSRFALGMRR
jgi:pilus assembly protein CpaE